MYSGLPAMALAREAKTVGIPIPNMFDFFTIPLLTPLPSMIYFHTRQKDIAIRLQLFLAVVV